MHPKFSSSILAHVMRFCLMIASCFLIYSLFQ